jgi:hypothetical protein
LRQARLLQGRRRAILSADHCNVRRTMPLFGVRTVIQLPPDPRGKGMHLYEERVTLFRAADSNEAIRSAEAEIAVYVADGGVALPFFQSFELYDDVAFSGNSVEVFSLIRDSSLAPTKYIDAFFDTGTEHQKNADA